ncbi:ABC transporter permease subunit [Bacillus sp. RG28]|uniref:ABC transporter permease subunit n=1 Tax=Gottfriedia endophytica TaxID=2820819 RepID=A0A940SJJ1_9BACI|nr:ABC transporter permease subunit [Gottfriedia endophytica]MBP0724293.1 ABC transporter permease subunit [Gottfriedia endophytica]
MFNQALWLKNSKQSKLVLILMYLLHLVIIPFSYFNKSIVLKEQINSVEQYKGIYIGEFSMLGFFSAFLMIAFAILLIGIERNSGGIDFQFSLPFTPKQLFFSKWIYGISHLIAAYLCTFILVIIIHFTTDLHQYITWTIFFKIFIILFLYSVAFFTTSLAIGTVTGHYFSQVLLTGFTLISIITLYFSVFANIKGLLNYDFHNIAIERFLPKITLPISLTSTNIYLDLGTNKVNIEPIDLTNIIGMICYIIIFFIVGLLCFNRKANENNGKLFLYKKFGYIMQFIFIYLIATGIALLTSAITETSRTVIYLIGLCIGLIVGHLFYKRLNKFFD